RDVDGERSVLLLHDGAAGRARRLDAIVRVGDDVPRTRPDQLREIVLVPRDLRRRDFAPILGEHAGLTAVELGERDEVLLPDSRRRSGHDTAVELFLSRGRGGAAGDGEVETVPFAPGVRPKKQPALPSQTYREATSCEQ